MTKDEYIKRVGPTVFGLTLFVTVAVACLLQGLRVNGLMPWANDWLLIAMTMLAFAAVFVVFICWAEHDFRVNHEEAGADGK